MVYAVQAYVAFRNAARRDNAINWCQTRISTENLWGPVITQAVDTTEMGSQYGMSLLVRFTTAAARDTFWNDMISQFGTGTNGPVAGSRASYHDCPHDQASPAPCTETVVSW